MRTHYPYTRHNSATPAERETLVREYVESRLKTDPAIQKAQEAVVHEAGVVPVALDLGSVLLRRAQTLTDPAARRAELEQAEKTFLAVRGLAGESDQYRLYLGQVYYWLGRHAEGRKLFDELLAAKQRDPQTLVGVSLLLREVGAVSDARSLAEEAYQAASDPSHKQEAAIQRALIPVDLEDQLTWLRRANPADPLVKAMLSTNLGHKARQEGKDQEAIRHLREAIAIYARQAPNAATLNNAATTYFDLYELTGEAEALTKGAEMLEQALALRPSDSVLLRNTAHAILEGALRDILGPAIDLHMLRMEGSFKLLAFLYQDQAGKAVYVQRVRQHAGIAKARAYLERLTVLAPKSEDAYETLASLHRFTGDREALRELRKRLEEVDLDLVDETRQMLDYYAGKEDARIRGTFLAQLERRQEELEATRKKGSVTLAVAATNLAKLRLNLEAIGLAQSVDQIVAWCEEAHQAAPSQATQDTLISAVLARAHQTLARQEPEYQRMASRALRPLGPAWLAGVVLCREGSLRQAFLQNADVQRALALIRESSARLPDEFAEWSWAMLRAAHPDDAARLARTILGDDSGADARAIGQRLSPLSASAAFRTYWAHLIAGREAEGIEALRRCAAQGMPLPFDPDS